MGYKCNQSSSTIKNEVTNKTVLDIIGSPSQFRVNPSGLIHSFKRYIKTKLSRHKTSEHHRCEKSTTTYKVSKIANNRTNRSIKEHEFDTSQVDCDTSHSSNVDEQELSLSSASSLAYKADQRIRTTRCTQPTTTALVNDGTANTKSSSSNVSCSHYVVRQSVCLYAASSVILALCYLTTPTSASTEAASHPV